MDTCSCTCSARAGGKTNVCGGTFTTGRADVNCDDADKRIKKINMDASGTFSMTKHVANEECVSSSL